MGGPRVPLAAENVLLPWGFDSILFTPLPTFIPPLPHTQLIFLFDPMCSASFYVKTYSAKLVKEKGRLCDTGLLPAVSLKKVTVLFFFFFLVISDSSCTHVMYGIFVKHEELNRSRVFTLCIPGCWNSNNRSSFLCICIVPCNTHVHIDFTNFTAVLPISYTNKNARRKQHPVPNVLLLVRQWSKQLR